MPKKIKMFDFGCGFKNASATMCHRNDLDGTYLCANLVCGRPNEWSEKKKKKRKGNYYYNFSSDGVLHNMKIKYWERHRN